MPDRHPKQRRWTRRLFMAVCVVGCVASPAPAVVAQGFDDIPESRVYDESLEDAIARVLAAGAEPAGLRAVHEGVEVFDPATGRALRQFLSERPVTAWCHARDAEWFVALAGGEVLRVDFLSRETERVAQFDGDVYWLHADGDLAWPRIDRAIAEHHIEGVGQARLLYDLSGDPNITRVESIESSFDSVHEDAWGRLWLLPRRGGRMTSLSYINIDAGTPHRISVPPMPNGDERVFGGVVEAPGERLFIWGQRRIGAVARLEFMAELVPPVFDDAVWEEIENMGYRRLYCVQPREFLLQGKLSVEYDTEISAFRLTDTLIIQSWLLPEGTNWWVDELAWSDQLLGGDDLEPNPFAIWDLGGQVEPATQGVIDWRARPAPPLPEDWPDAFVYRLKHLPPDRSGRIGTGQSTNFLTRFLFDDVVEDQEHHAHVCAASNTDWLLGLDTGQIVYFDDAIGKFQLLTEVEGVPLSITIRGGDHWTRKTLEIIYQPFGREDNAICSRTMTCLFSDRWRGDGEDSGEATPGWVWATQEPMDSRLELRPNEDEGTEVVWTLPLEPGESVVSSGLRLNGLFLLPDNSVISYGSSGAGTRPILIHIDGESVETIWTPSLPWFGECSPMPEGEITHARYIPEAGRILLIADGQLWSTGPWLGPV